MTTSNWISATQAAITAALAFIAVGIARQQARTARQKLRLEMFSLRFNVYTVAHSALGSALYNPRMESSTKLLAEFQAKLAEARFLFNKANFDFLDDLFSQLYEYQHLSRATSDQSASVDRIKLLVKTIS